MEVSAAKKARSPPHMPIEMIRHILFKLKMKALIRCECVCKEWRSTIEDPDFKLSYRGGRRLLVAAASDRNLAFTSITTDGTPRIKTLFSEGDWRSGIWCSCNGLVLFSVRQHILLWNPSTRCCTKVLEICRLLNPYLWYRYNEVSASGLCYVPSTGDYKAVLLFRPDGTAMVASLRNKQWQKVSFPFHAMSVRDSGVNFRNTLHWRVAHSATDWCSSRRCKKVVYFDAESDEFKELPIPTFPAKSSAILGLGIIDDGYLCMAREKRKETGEVEVLVMKEYGVKNSWISQFVISGSQFRSDYHRDFTLYSSKYSTQVLIGSCLYGWWGTLVYHFKNKKLENFLEAEAESGHKNHTAAICSYVQSFVSPQEFSWRDDDDERKNDYVLRFILKEFNI
ncbi:F-box/kelch-repeat protein At3g23880-like [Ipomoea triloba]|uniref:F-box/kelch-repeat protein At3g23880-like n=1 Tax=Ipomoea triloba TaxID=35885 RepID=UPI00125E23C1|nr:F-box/kelch-repeat protein At3g23880-like [Ipomoea triloba]